MKKIIYCFLLAISLGCQVSCSGDDEEDEKSPNISVVIGEDGKASNGSKFVAVDDNNFYIDYILYTVKGGRLIVSGIDKYDKDGFNGVAKIVSSLTYKGKYYEVLGIGDNAFSYCSNLTSVIIPNGLKIIGCNAFEGSSISSISISNSVTTIGEESFRNCEKLKSIDIPNGVIKIECRLFEGCHNLTSVNISNSVKEIKGEVFKNCTALSSITIPNSVTSMGEQVFMYSTGLTSVTLPTELKSIERGCFSGCTSLTSITIPPKVEYISTDAFVRCPLTSISVASGNTKFDSRDNCNAIIETSSNTLIKGCQSTIIPNSVTSIGDSAFSGCSNLTSIVIPNSVTSIGDYAFSGCSMASIVIPNSVTSIGDYAFSSCSNLTSIVIPNSVTSIGGYAFHYCLKLNTIISLIENPFPFVDSIFELVVYNNSTLYVPIGTIEKYKNTEGWKNFSEIKEGTP